eukprot:529891_1
MYQKMLTQVSTIAASEHTNRWINLASLPYGCVPHKMINTDPHEFIAVTATTHVLYVYEYNIDKDKWNNYTYPLGGNYTRAIPFNKKVNTSFMYRSFGILPIKILTHEKIEFKQQIPTPNCVLFINNNFHIFKTDKFDKYIGSIQSETLKTLDNIIDNRCSQLKRAVVVYVRAKQCILLIGGYYKNGNASQYSRDIWKYCLSSGKWTKKDCLGLSNIPNSNIANYCGILTSNQRYIVLLGGLNICVLDMIDDNNWKMRQCKIKCPIVGLCHVSVTGNENINEMLVIGFVKACFKMKQFSHLSIPPVYIINIMTQYFNEEMIHHIRNQKHHAIYLAHILSALSD